MTEPTRDDVVVERWSAEVAVARVAEIWPVYDDVFADQPSLNSWREAAFDRHAQRDGFRLVAAIDAGAIVGFGYGYVGERGQYWPDRVAATLSSAVADKWVGGHFEVVTIGVLGSHRRRGLGGALLDGLLDGVPATRALLGTDADESPAVRLYRSRGWQTLGLLEPGVQVMGVALCSRP